MEKKSRAFTLVELLVVVALIALLFSGGVVVFIAIGSSKRLEANAGTIRAMIRKARDTARMDKGFGVLYLSTKEKRMKVGLSQTVAYFHFEPADVQGSQGNYQVRSGGEADLLGTAKGIQLEDGHLGKGILFPTKDSLIQFPSSALLNPTAGIAMDLWMYVPDPTLLLKEGEKEKEKDSKKKGAPKEFYLIQKNQSYLLRITEDRKIEAGVRGYDEKGTLVNHFVQTYPQIFPFSDWVHVEFRFYRGSVMLSVDGIPRKTQLLTMQDNGPVAPQTLFSSPEPLLVGGGDFPAKIDQLRISAISESEEVQLPSNYHLEVEGAVPFYEEGDPKKKNISADTIAVPLYYKVYFDSRGELDSRQHNGSVRISIGELEPETPSASQKPSTSEKKSASQLLKWKHVIYIGIDPSGALLSPERSEKLIPGESLKIKDDQRKVK